MANLTIADVCNLQCPYCFAATHMATMQDRSPSAFIALEAFDVMLDFLDRSGIDQARLIGGEPTLHPHFPELVRRARQRGKAILVFSNGLMPERVLACLEALAPEVCSVLINANATPRPGAVDANVTARQEQTIRRLGQRVLLGYTIYRPDVQLEPLLDLIETHNCHRAIRLGLAQPILGGDNAYLHPKQYPVVGHRIARFAPHAADQGVRLEFDCGFVRCMFASADLAILRQCGADVDWRCNPILDLTLDGQAVHCFPLAESVRIPAVTAADDTVLRQELAALHAPYRTAGVYRECSTCLFKQNNECTGGCLAATMRRFRNQPFRLVVPDETRCREEYHD